MEVLDRHKIVPKEKAQMNIPLCRMISMLVMKSTLKIDVLKMEHAFHMGYREGDKVFFVSATIWQREEALVEFCEED
jgi:hypothetical protein